MDAEVGKGCREDVDAARNQGEAQLVGALHDDDKDRHPYRNTGDRNQHCRLQFQEMLDVRG